MEDLKRFEDQEHIPQSEKMVDDCRACIFYTLCIDDGRSLCWADVQF